MKNIEELRKSRSFLSITILTIFTLMFLVGVDTAQAQWTTPDTYGNTNYPNGSVGIGTTNPAGIFGSGPTLNLYGGLPSIRIQDINSSSDWTITTRSGPSSNLFRIYDNVGSQDRLVINSSGNVGLGTNSPGVKLHVSNGASTRAQITVSDNNTASLMLAGGGSLPGVLASDTSLRFRTGANYLNADSGGVTAMTIDTVGNIGVGTTGPGAKLDIFSSGTARVLAGDGCVGSGTYGGIGLGITSFSNCQNYALLSEGTNLFVNAPSGSGTIHIRAGNNSNSGNDNVTILSDGKVGIGTTSPTKALDVHGDINVTGNIAAKYQDVAEWVPSTHALAAGTVVILNPDKSNQVMASISAYDTRVAGVVSERPGLALGEGGKDKVLVATTGRVKVKVDATRAPIHVGDLLVTSDQEGVAMKSEPVDLGGVKIHRPGTLIGKALEPLERGTGEVLVLLSLQ